MTDIILQEFTDLSLAQQLNVTPNLVIVHPSSPEVMTLFRLVKGKTLLEAWDSLQGFVHYSGEELLPIEVATAWAAVNTTSKTSLEEMVRVYRVASEFVWEHSTFVLEEEKFNSKVKELRILYTGGLSHGGHQARLDALEGLRNWYESLEMEKVFDFSVEERILELQHDVQVGHEMTLFDNIQTSDDLPFVAINLNEERTEKKGVKVSTDRKFKLQNNPTKGIHFPLEWIPETNIPQTIQMKLFVKGEGEENKSSYSTVEYLFNTNQILLYYPLDGSEKEQVVLERFMGQIGGVKFGVPKDYQITGSFIVRNLPVDNRLLMDMIMQDPILREFMYVDESQNTFAQKKRLTIHLKIAGQHLSITIGLKKAKQSEVFMMGGHGTRLKPSETYLHVQINKSPNPAFSEWTVTLVRKLLTMYVRDYQEIAKEYKRVIPTMAIPVIKRVDEVAGVVETDESMTKLKRLKLADPDAFITHYATKCQAPSQPLVIREDQVEEWQKKGYQVVKYPSHVTNGKQFNYRIQNYYVSDNPDAPFLGLMSNPLANAENYPYLICAYKEKHLEVGKDWEVKILKLGDEEEESHGNSKEYILDANKVLEEGRRGYLKRRITGFLNQSNLVRLGMPNSPSSLLHCLLFATDPNYNGEESFVRETRTNMAKRIPSVLAKQEAYDMTTEQIGEFVMGDGFLDPAVYYRLVEEYFNVNLFTFTEDELEVPRHKFFHLHTTKKRPIVLIYKHGPPVNQCEIIIGGETRLFENLSLENLLHQMARTVAVQIQQSYDDKHFYETPTIETRLTVPNVNFNWTLSGQYIDGAGKVRAQLYKKGEKEVSIYVPFLPPSGVPLRRIEVTKEEDAKEFCRDNGVEYVNGSFVKDGIGYRFEMMLPVENQVKELQNVMRQANLMKDILEILNSLYPGDLTTQFIVRRGTLDLPNLPQRLPKFTSYDDALNYFTRKWPSLFYKGKIVAQSEHHLKGMSHFVKLSIKGDLPMFLPRYFVNVTDFTKHHPYEMIFVNATTLATTMVTMHQENKQVYDNLFFSQQPYLLRHQNILYLVQNVYNFERERAVALIYHWYHNLMNMGFYTSKLDFDYPVHEVEYDSRTAIPDKSIIKFQTGYCAVLPLNIQVIHEL